MASLYPNALDAFATGHADLAGEIIHAGTVNDLADGVNKIEAELGTNPRGTYATVKDRLAFSGARAFSATAVTIPNNADTIVPLDSEHYDTDGYHSLVTNPSRITIPTNGKYHVGCCLTMDANSVGRRYATLRLNGTFKIANLGLDLNIGADTLGHRPVGGPSCDWDFIAGDYVELIAFQDSGGSLLLSVFTDQETAMWIHRLT